MKTSRAGFTLLEALVVILIIGIISSVSLVAYNQMRPKIQLTNTGREVISFFNRARLTAIRMHRTVTITLEMKDGGESETYNPTGVEAEWLVAKVQDAFGNEEEISSYQLPKSYPPVYVWGDGETTIHGTSSNTFPSDVVTFNSDGTVGSTGALRFSSPKSGIRNILEVAIVTKSGSPVLRKYLENADRPSTATAQEYFIETTATKSSKNIWVWY